MTPVTATTRQEDDIAVIPLARLAFIDTRLPSVSADKRNQLVNFAIEDKLTIDPATVHATVLGASLTGAQHFIIAAVESDWLTRALAWLAQHGITPRQALAASSLIAVAENEWRVILDGARSMAIRADGLAYALHTDDSLAPPFELVLALNEAIAAESGRAAPKRIRVSGKHDTAPLPIDTAAWAAQLGNGVEMISEAASALTLSPQRLRESNLLTKRFLPASIADSAIFALKGAWILGFIILLLQLVFVAADAWRLNRERVALESNMRSLFITTFPDARAIVDPALQLSRNLNSLILERGQSSDPARELLAMAALIVQDQPELNVELVRVNVGADRLTLSFRKGALAEGRRLNQLLAAVPIGLQAEPVNDDLVLTRKVRS